MSRSFATSLTVDFQVPLSLEFSREEYWSGLPFPFPGYLPHPRIKPRSPTLQADSLPSEPPRKPKNTGVGSLSLLQRIFLTQESNWGLLHCRWILYQLSYRVKVKVLVAQSCPILCNPMDCSMPGFPVHHQLPELAQTHVHRVNDAIQPSHPLLSPSPLAPNPSQHQSLFQ